MIKTIIFDFGDVFLDLDKAATQRELEQFDIAGLNEDIHQKNLDYEQGHITSEHFISAYCNRFPRLSAETFTRSWNAILVGFPEYRLNFLKNLAQQKKYTLILLSNTNDIHIEWVKKNVPFFEEFKECFDAFYLSQELRLRKPDPSIFHHVLQQHDLKPEETLFIDDTPENTAAAEALHIHTWNIDPETQDVVDLFQIKKDLF